MFGGGKAVADAVDANTGDVLKKMLTSSVVIFLSGRKERKVIYAD